MLLNFDDYLFPEIVESTLILSVSLDITRNIFCKSLKHTSIINLIRGTLFTKLVRKNMLYLYIDIYRHILLNYLVILPFVAFL